MKNIINLDTVDKYNSLFGLETQHPLVSIVDLAKATRQPEDFTCNYGVYALFLKQVKCGDIRYGRQIYDYQEGTVTSFAPGQVVRAAFDPNVKPAALGLIFHPDLIAGTSLGREIRRYTFFSYSSSEALHLSEEEKGIFIDCLTKIEAEIHRPVDRHSKRLISRNIELLLDYCMRFYERQFITRAKANHDILSRFEDLLSDYFKNEETLKSGLPTVKYFADKICLSPNYFGDLIKKETGKTPQEYIQSKIIETAKEQILYTDKTVSQIAFDLGFQYSQHFIRVFKKTSERLLWNTEGKRIDISELFFAKFSTWVTEIVNGVIPGRSGTDEAEEAKKSPRRGLLAGSMGRRLPTLPPRLGQYHRHKRV